MGGLVVQIDAEGTNEIPKGETYMGWSALFVKPDNTTVTATIIEFDSSKLQPGAGAQVFKIRYLATDPNGKDKGNWYGRSILQFSPIGSFAKSDSKSVAVP